MPVTKGFHDCVVAFSSPGKTLAVGYDSSDMEARVLLWDVATRQRLVGEPLPVEAGFVESMAFSPDGKTLAAGYGYVSGGGVVLWDLDLTDSSRVNGT
jgi:WD40 repeat protein